MTSEPNSFLKPARFSWPSPLPSQGWEGASSILSQTFPIEGFPASTIGYVFAPPPSDFAIAFGVPLQQPQFTIPAQIDGFPEEVDEDAPRGIRNNNPGNIEFGPFAESQGAIGSDGRFAIFPTPEMGIAAIVVLQRIYEDRYGLLSPNARIGRWAPANENNVAAYAGNVAGTMGIGVDDDFTVRDAAATALFLEAMIRHENGLMPYSSDQLLGAYALAFPVLEETPPPPLPTPRPAFVPPTPPLPTPRPAFIGPVSEEFPPPWPQRSTVQTSTPPLPQPNPLRDQGFAPSLGYVPVTPPTFASSPLAQTAMGVPSPLAQYGEMQQSTTPAFGVPVTPLQFGVTPPTAPRIAGTGLGAGVPATTPTFAWSPLAQPSLFDPPTRVAAKGNTGNTGRSAGKRVTASASQIGGLRDSDPMDVWVKNRTRQVEAKNAIPTATTRTQRATTKVAPVTALPNDNNTPEEWVTRRYAELAKKKAAMI